jgi:hypothetical protein
MGTGLVTKLFSQRTGAQLLSGRQVAEASIGNVMKLFHAHGASEKERLEMGYYLQRMIMEGQKSGVDIYSMIRAKGGLNFKPLGDDPTGHSGRMQRFMTQATKQLVTARREHYDGLGVTGEPRRAYNQQVFQDIEKQVSSASLGDSIKNCFTLLKTFQDQIGITDPNTTKRGLLSPPPIASKATMPASSVDMQGNVLDAVAAVIPRGKMDPANAAVLGTQARSGIASAAPISMPAPAANGAQPGTGRGNKVIVYNGADWTSEANDMAKQIRAMGYQVDLVSNLSGVNYDQYAAVFMPGGNAGTEASAIGQGELRRLSAAVNSGLNYFGSCAGAFLAGSYGANSLGLVNKAFDYPTGSFSQTHSQTHDTVVDAGLLQAVGGQKNFDILQYGGPAVGGVAGAKTLVQYPDGEASIIEAMHGQGMVILTGGHPGVLHSTDPTNQVDDTVLFDALAKAVITGTDPGGTPPVTTNPDGTTTNTTNNITRTSPQVVPQGIGGGGGSGGPQVRAAPNVALAGMLDPGIKADTTGFAQALQQLGGSSGGNAMDSFSGSLARLKGL